MHKRLPDTMEQNGTSHVLELPRTPPSIPAREQQPGSMTNRYTNGEWAAIIKQTEEAVVVSQEAYPCPEIGSTAFMKTIDHTLLKLEAKSPQFDDLCAEARVDGFATVCVRPQFVQQCNSDLKGSDVKVDTVIGFHEGTYDLYYKSQETKQSLEAGANELDVVVNYPQLQVGDYESIHKELATLRTQADHPIVLKLILETSQLNRSQIVAGCVMAASANFDFVKTSTGFNGQGATEDNVRLMAACCEKLAAGGGKKMQVKASGGIRTLDDALKMLEAGASRLGTSAGVWIAKEARESVARSLSSPSSAESKNERPGLSTRLYTDY